MSKQRVPEGLSKEDHNFFKIYKIMSTEINTVLHFLFSEACPKLPMQTLRDYLLGKGMSRREFESHFDVSQRKILDRDPTGREFDISLFSTAIPVSCQRLTPKLLDFVRELRQFRNCFLHVYQSISDVDVRGKELQDLLKDTYSAIGTQYKLDVTNEIRKMEDNVDTIINVPIPVPDIVKYQQDLKTFQDELEADFCVKGKEELRINPNFSTTTDPASFIPGREATLKVTAIYTPIDLVVQELSFGETDYSVEFENILTVLDQYRKIPNIIILEGPPGAGKTTLTKCLYAQWENCLQGGHCSIINLDKFDLVFPYECSNTSLSSYEDLIISHLPKSTLCLRNEDIVRSARQLSVLILVDAADDLNSKSETLLRELLERHVPESKGKLRILCTTRPQALKDLLSMMQNSKLTKVHTKITGIPSNRRGEFVKCLHDEMINEGQSTQDTEGLVDYLKTADGRLGDHFKFPLMLSLLTYLWAVDPGAISGVTTISKLYLVIHRLIQEKLFVRLRNHEKMKGKNLSQIKKSCRKFLSTLYRESLVVISLDKINWPEKCINNLMSAAGKYGLPDIDVTAAFLTHTCKWTAIGYLDQYAGSHKSMVEFYAAFHVIEVITGNIKTKHQLDLERKLSNGSLNQSDKLRVEEELVESKTVSGILKKNHKEMSNSCEISKYLNILVHLLGLLNSQGKDVLDQYHEEVIKLMESCRNGLDWFQVVSEVDRDSSVTRFIAERLTEKEKEIWSINESTNMKAAIEMIKTVSPKKVNIKLVTDLSTQTDLPDLLDKLSQSNCIVELEDKWSFRNPEKSSADLYLSLISRCMVKKILTSVKTITALPKVVVDLNLGLLEDPINRAVEDPGLSDLRRYFPQLESIAINVKAGGVTDSLSRLPELPNRAGLFLSEMTEESHIEWAVNTMNIMQPGHFARSRKGFGFLGLPNCNLSVDQLCDFVEQLAAKKVTIWKKGYLWIESIHKNQKDDWKKLRHAIKHNLHCSLQWDEVK